MKIIELRIKGMTCPSCSAAVEKITDELEGIKSKTINHATDSGVFEFDENIISEKEIIAKINEGHYKVDIPEGMEITVLADIPPCPTCNKIGKKVFNSVFKSNVKPASLQKIDMKKQNYICYNSDCETVYYNENKMIIDHSELKREVWFKKVAKRKIICYCNNIDKEQIREAIKNYNFESWEDITSHYRKKVIEKCEVLNPTGYCCRDTFDKVVNKLKKEIKSS
jgi:copper chaperone CopZ/bacterioferritin-associated ferredoxin/CRISPR/Cas system-associated endoribonuclease Cas2